MYFAFFFSFVICQITAAFFFSVFAYLYHFRLLEQSLNSFHHAHCYVPAEVKYVLDQKPSLISPIVRAFYERDPIDMKVCWTAVFHSPQSPLREGICIFLQEVTNVVIVVTSYLYRQLLSEFSLVRTKDQCLMLKTLPQPLG